MKFIVNGTANVVCTLKPSRASMTNPLKFHLQVVNVVDCTEELFNNPVVVPAVGPSANSPGTNGSVTFTGVSFPSEGLYLVRLMYATQVDLDGNPVSLTTVLQDTVKKIVPETTITL